MTEPTLESVMADELTSDLAQRYFGFRKLIEEDTLDLEAKTRQYSFILQKRISFDLLRIYVALGDDGLVHRFLALINLDRELFYDPYLITSPAIARRVFSCQHFHGWTQYGRYRHFIFDCYENLLFHAGMYQQKLALLHQEEEDIAEEIKTFYRQNDISAIIHFLHSLHSEKQLDAMQGGLEVGLAEDLAAKLRIVPPRPVDQILPALPPLPPLDEIKGELRRLLKEAWAALPAARRAVFRLKKTPCERRLPAGETAVDSP